MRFISDLLYCVLSFSGLYFGACYQFGDSFMDVGNAILLNPSLPANKPPYGESISGNRTGRWSDGLLICDNNGNGDLIPYLAMTWNTSSLNSASNEIPSLLSFAVARSTVLNKSTLLGFCVTTPEVPDLRTQIDWFKSYFQSLCDTFGSEGCQSIIGSANFYFGPFGGIDIIYALTQNKMFQEIMTMIPLIVNVIFEATTEFINMGASYVQIPLNFPLGCFPFARNYFSNVNHTLYDAYGCVESVNNLIIYMNNLIISTARNLSSNYINIADYYNPTLSLIQDPHDLNSTVALEPCCGNGVFNLSSQFCSGTDASVCDDPSKYIHWDEIHLTQTAYAYIYHKYGFIAYQ